jgi:hypothetical protein
VREEPPRTTAANELADGIDDLPDVDTPWPTTRPGR